MAPAVVKNESFFGLACGIGAYGIWGLAPLYWRQYEGVTALELLFHRVVWGLVILTGWILLRREVGHFKKIFKSPRTMIFLGLSTCLIFGNWFLFVYSVNTGHVLEASLGYYINPLMNVVLGAIFFGERPRRGQKIALIIALVAVVIALSEKNVGRIDLSFGLALTFAFYGLIRKLARVSSTHGLFIEMLFALPLCLVVINFIATPEYGSELLFWEFSTLKKVGLMFAGVLTVFPLFAFNEAVTRLSLTTMGILQYLAPSGQFLLGYFLYQEPVSSERLIVFGLIWFALILYSYEGRRYKKGSERGAA